MILNCPSVLFHLLSDLSFAFSLRLCDFAPLRYAFLNIDPEEPQSSGQVPSRETDIFIAPLRCVFNIHAAGNS